MRQPDIAVAAGLEAVPVALRTTALCESLLPDYGHDTGFFKSIPESAFSRTLAEAALVRCADLLEYIPERLIDRALCEHALACGASMDDVPAALIDEDMAATFIGTGSVDRFNKDLSMEFSAPAYLMMAVERYKSALDTIPGCFFGRALYECALRMYGRDPDWPEIVARHHEAIMKKRPKTVYAEVCWSVFWTEPVMLKQIARRVNPLMPYNIPSECYTRAVAEACARMHPIYLETMPLQWVDASMCERPSRRFTHMLELIPVALRSKKICTRAMKHNPRALAQLPLAMRSVKFCVAAILARPARAELVPRRLRREVFDTLIAQHSGQFGVGWLYLQRGDGALCADPPDIAMALADYRFVFASGVGEGVSEDEIGMARYRIAYCHYLRGEVPSPAEALDRSADWPDFAEFGFTEPPEPLDVDPLDRCPL